MNEKKLDEVTERYQKEGDVYEGMKQMLNEEMLFKSMKTEKERKAYFKN